MKHKHKWDRWFKDLWYQVDWCVVCGTLRGTYFKDGKITHRHYYKPTTLNAPNERSEGVAP